MSSLYHVTACSLIIFTAEQTTIKTSEIGAKMFHNQAKKNKKDAREGMRKDLKTTCRVNIVSLLLEQGEEGGLYKIPPSFLPSISKVEISTSHICFIHLPLYFLCAHVNFAFFLNFHSPPFVMLLYLASLLGSLYEQSVVI